MKKIMLRTAAGLAAVLVAAGGVQLGTLPAAEAAAKPAVPSGTRAAGVSPAGATLTWSASRGAERYKVQAATDSHFRKVAASVTTTDSRPQAAFNTLMAGTKYYFRVRAISGSGKSLAWSSYGSAAAARTLAAGTRLNVLSFNVGTASHDTSKTSHNWVTRKKAVVETIAGSGADVVGVQEAYASDDYAGADGVTPQWEDLRRALKARGYERALTGTDGLYNYDQCHQAGCWKDEYRLDGNHIFYKASVLKPAGKGGKISLPNPDGRGAGYTATWQQFKKRDGSGEFFAVNTHLYPTGITERGIYEKRRTAQTEAILAGLKKVKPSGMPVVLTGDLNSHGSHQPVGTLLRGGFNDGAAVDVPKKKANFNSSHGYLNPPPAKYGTRIDYVMASRNVGVKYWGLLADIDPKTGRFVGTIPSDHHAIKAVLVLPKA